MTPTQIDAASSSRSNMLPEPDVIVVETVNVTLSASEVELALKLHLTDRLAPKLAPMPGPGEIVIRWVTAGDGEAIYSATLSYAPDTRGAP